MTVSNLSKGHETHIHLIQFDFHSPRLSLLFLMSTLNKHQKIHLKVMEKNMRQFENPHTIIFLSISIGKLQTEAADSYFSKPFNGANLAKCKQI